MRILRLNHLAFAFLFAVLVTLGCNKTQAPPEPLALEQLPTAIDQAFAKAKPDLKAQADKIVAAVKSQDYGTAYTDLQNLSVAEGLSKEQINTATRSVITVYNLLQEAQAKGDAKADTAIKNYMKTK